MFQSTAGCTSLHALFPFSFGLSAPFWVRFSVEKVAATNMSNTIPNISPQLIGCCSQVDFEQRLMSPSLETLSLKCHHFRFLPSSAGSK